MQKVFFDGCLIATSTHSELQYQRDEVARWMKRYVHLQSKTSERVAAVFDIDATLVHANSLIEPIVDLYNDCMAMNVTCFMVTARPSEAKEFTCRQLDELGIARPRHIFFHPTDLPCKNSEQAGRQKLTSRNRIVNKGYRIIVNVGDAFHDHYVPSERSELHEKLHNKTCFAFIDTRDGGVAHVKLAHP
jgi:predicted secreted acid phosphatase